MAQREPAHRALRKAWRETVSADDYDAHMEAVGQARANAELVRDLVLRFPPGGPRLLVAGAGTGQMLDFVDSALFAPFQVTFTDLSRTLLARLAERLVRLGWRNHEVRVDDLERTRLVGSFDGAVVVLVLEHLDWRRAVASLCRLEVGRCYIVIQLNPAHQPGALAPHRPATGSMEVFRQVHPQLVPRHELVEALSKKGYALIVEEPRPVPDGKTMLGLVFTRVPLV
jgi:SAM-dependent methyltransferase